MSPARPLKVILYAAFVGLLLASCITPLQEIMASRTRIADMRADLVALEKSNVSQRRLLEELETPAGVERVARERYGMVKPGEKVYIVPGEGER